ncbi:rep protein, partial [Salmonella enterica subsp. enterica serovar Muenchen]
TEKELANRCGCPKRTVLGAWPQPRADHLAKTSTSRDKPWKPFGFPRATGYRRGKPMPSETDNQSETA